MHQICRGAGGTSTRRNGGFTLIELMVTIAIIAIVVAIALPAYQDHLRKGRRAAAQAFLVDAASRQSQYLLDARSYAVGGTALASLNVTVPADVTRFYVVTVTPDAPTVPPTYTLVATPVAGSAQDADGVLTLDHTGARSHKGNPGW